MADLAGPHAAGPGDVRPAATLAERDRATVWHPYAPMPSAVEAVEVIGANGSLLHLGDGREVIDGMSSWWSAIHGYRHPVLDAAVVDQLSSMSHVMFGGLTHAPAVELAELLVAISPDGLEHVFLCDSGSVAVDVAIKMALQFWQGEGVSGKTRLLTVRGGYHGDTFGAMSVCDPVTGMHHMFTDVLPAQLFAPIPSPAYGEPFEQHHIDAFEQLLVAHRAEVAAVILEPIVQGAGGMRFYAPGYLTAVRELCDRHDVLLIADEIATGFGRTGELFGCDHAGVRPDIACVGKALTGGYLSMAATLCTSRVAAGVSAAESGALMHGPTFMANPLAAAVARASVQLLLDGPWRERVGQIEGRLVDGLAPVRELPGVADVRVLGAIGVIETDEPLDPQGLQRTLLDEGVWLRPFGRLVYTMPTFISTPEEVDRICAAMVAAVTQVGAAT